MPFIRIIIFLLLRIMNCYKTTKKDMMKINEIINK